MRQIHFHKVEDFIVQDHGSILEGKEPIDEVSFEDKVQDHKEKLKFRFFNKKNKKAYMSRKRQSDPCMIYSCTKCEFLFKKQGPLRRHELKEHMLEIQCEECPERFLDFKAYQRHSKGHLTYICEECGEAYPSKSQLNSHENYKHSKGDTDKSCPYCSKHVFNLKLHIKTRHEAEMLACSKCEYKTRIKRSMESHYKNMHKDAVLNTCEFFGGSFKRLDKHNERNMCRTENQVRFDCESCDKPFSMKHSLANHIKVVHLKIRNKACTYCST